jgi:hypothetical protein
MTSTEPPSTASVHSNSSNTDRTFKGRPSELLLTYCSPAIVGVVIVLIAFAPWAWPTNGIVPDGGDVLWVQAMAEVHSQSGPFAADPHFGWPIGLSPWSHPQLGMFFGIVTWILGSVGIASAAAGMVALALVAGLTSMGVTFMLRGIVGARFKIAVATFAVLFAITPFVIQKYGHFGVAAYFILPMTLGIAARNYRSKRKRLVLVALVAVAALFSPAWWLAVSGLVLGFVLLLALLTGRKNAVITSAMALIPCAIGAAFQVIMQRIFSEDATVTTRSPWDSNILGGHLVDLFTGSPWLNGMVGLEDVFRAGSSPGLSPVGLVLTLAAGFSVFLVLAVFPGRIAQRDTTYMLRMLTSVSVLLFVVGGLGNLQAGIAVAMGGSSPARVWARMTILLALIGVAWILVAVRDTEFAGRLRGPALAAPLLAAISALALLDAGASTTVKPEPQQSFSEYAPVSFLRSNLDPCPVAQLPQDDFPLPRLEDPKNFATFVPTFYYRPFVPYLIAPEFYWSYGSWNGETDNGLNDVPVAMTDSSLLKIKQQGFCAVLYDQELAALAREKKVPLEGRDLAVKTKPDFAEGRYSVYLLR